MSRSSPLFRRQCLRGSLGFNAGGHGWAGAADRAGLVVSVDHWLKCRAGGRAAAWTGCVRTAEARQEPDIREDRVHLFHPDPQRFNGVIGQRMAHMGAERADDFPIFSRFTRRVGCRETALQISMPFASRRVRCVLYEQ